jgi:hypothetical protein
MSDQPFGSAATFFDTTGRTGSGGGQLADILQALRLPREVRAESPVPAEVRAALGLPAEAGSAETLPVATACFELHIGNTVSVGLAAQVPIPPPQVVIPFQVTVDLTAIPYAVLSGTFIFDSPEVTGWQITQGSYFGSGRVTSPSVPPPDELFIVGEYISTTSEVAAAADSLFVPPQVLISGSLRPPLSYPGVFFSGGGLYNQNTLFRGWQACS